MRVLIGWRHFGGGAAERNIWRSVPRVWGGVLQAAFAAGLGQYCLDCDIAHPDFIVLDSPLVTYRRPGRNPLAQVSQSLPKEIVADFDRDIQASFDGQ